MSLVRLSVLASIGCALLGRPLMGQSDSARARIDSLLEAVEQVSTAADLTPPAACQQPTQHVDRLCQGFFAMRRAELTGAVDDVDAARTILNRVVGEEPKWVLGWYFLARVRFQAQRSGMPAREGPLQQIGGRDIEGAAAALGRAVEVEPDFRPAWEALALTPLAWDKTLLVRERLEQMRKGRRYLSPAALVGAAALELDAGSPDSAVAILRGVLRTTWGGAPKGLAQITLARALYRINQPKEGRAALLAGAAETDSGGIAAYREQLAWVGDSAEMRTWEKLAPAARPAWLANFWAERDVREGRRDGERLIEHYRRVAIAYQRYRIALPATGQQTTLTDPLENEFRREGLRILDQLARVRTVQVEGKRMEISYISEDTRALIAEYFDARGTVGAQSPFRAFRSGQTILDDRGMIFVRHGEPTLTARASPGMLKLPDPGGNIMLRHGILDSILVVDSVTLAIPHTAMMVWRYDRPAPQPPLVVSFVSTAFSGQVEPTVLVPTLLAEDPRSRADLCAVDRSLCPMFGDLVGEAKARQLSLGKIAEARQAGLEVIRTAVTSDAFARVFPKAMHPSVQLHRLDLAQGGSPRLVVAFAIPGDELTGTPTANGQISYPVMIEMSAVRGSDARRAQRDTLRRYVMPHRLAKGEFLSGLVELPLAPGDWTASVVLSQTGGAGAIVALDEVLFPAWTTRLAVSDLVLGREDVALRWHSGPGGQPVALNPLNTFPAGSSAVIYAQLAGTSPGESFDVTIELFKGKGTGDEPALRVKFSDVAAAARVEFRRTLGLANLAPGRYLVRLTIQSGEQRVVTTGGLEIIK